MPTDYELTSTRLLWYPERGFEVSVPLAGWYRSHQRGSALQAADWERFVDPRQTTYSGYVAQQRDREAFADGVLRTIEDRRYDASLPRDWAGALERLLPVARFPGHAMQMLAAYVGQMAPCGRIVIACAFQAADELRRVQRLTERMVQLRRTLPGFGEAARADWENHAAWQPLREVIERAMVAWDWGEAFVALALCIAPLFDDALLIQLARVARGRGDPLLEPLLASLAEDCAWHRAWARALVTTAIEQRPENRDALEGWLARWAPPARAAIRALDALVSPDSIAEGALRVHAELIASLELRMP
jgi:toluene monooxygenase system protein E